MIRRPPRSTRTDTLFPYTTLFRSSRRAGCLALIPETPVQIRPDPNGLFLPNRNLRCRSEEHTSELQSLMRISYAVFCLKKKKHTHINTTSHNSDRLMNSVNSINLRLTIDSTKPT